MTDAPNRKPTTAQATAMQTPPDDHDHAAATHTAGRPHARIATPAQIADIQPRHNPHGQATARIEPGTRVARTRARA